MEAIAPVPIVALYAAGHALLHCYLSIDTVYTRIRTNAHLGEPDFSNELALRRVRAHANNVEYVPLALLLLLIFEMNNGLPVIAHGFGAFFLAIRLIHSYGLRDGTRSKYYRYVGFWGTVITIASVSLMNILIALNLNLTLQCQCQ